MTGMDRPTVTALGVAALPSPGAFPSGCGLTDDASLRPLFLFAPSVPQNREGCLEVVKRSRGGGNSPPVQCRSVRAERSVIAERSGREGVIVTGENREETCGTMTPLEDPCSTR